MGTPGPAPFAAPQQRTPVLFDSDTGGLRIGPYERHVDDPAEPTQVYSAYLSLLYAVRGAEPGEKLALRSADLEALLLLVGDDPETIEQRLIGLMGCTPEEASVLGGLLLRHRRVTATLGIAATLALGAGGMVAAVDEPTPTAAPAAVVETGPAEKLTPIAGTTTSAPTQAATPTFVGPPTSSVTVSAPQVSTEREPTVAAEPVDVVPVPVEAAAPAAPRPPVVVAPVAVVAEAPPAPTPVVEPETYVLPLYEDPVLDAPPPVEEVEQPAVDIGEPAILDLEPPLPEIGGVTDSGELKGGDTAPGTDEPPLDLQVPVEVVAEEPSDSPPAEDVEAS